ncbi:glycosyltransferase [Frankia sp. CiP1_Cm_nod2]|uniref:glycosyltransferase n=1 Tax=Frankia sp. CiP1_Cm_nod2 TaxID=2897161 RepID=UPI002024E4A0
MKTENTGTVLVDCAGARMGGARRLLLELESYLVDNRRPDVRVIGRDQPVSPAWLIQRERPWRHRRVVSLNNVGFVVTPARRWLLLHQPQHFLDPEEIRKLGGRVDREIPWQAQVVRQAARRSDMIVVPTTGMARRVAMTAPDLSSRISVRPNPLSMAPEPVTGRRPEVFLCPVLFARWKRMGDILRTVDEAVDIVRRGHRTEIEVLVTATPWEARAEGLGDARHLRFIGRITHTEVARYRRRSWATIYPTRIESFGYPLAEARLAAQPVVAHDTPHNREVAGGALVPFTQEHPDDIADAIRRALETRVPPEPGNPFDRDRYFDWMLGATEATS